jgi:hypothetical protein
LFGLKGGRDCHEVATHGLPRIRPHRRGQDLLAGDERGSEDTVRQLINRRNRSHRPGICRHLPHLGVRPELADWCSGVNSDDSDEGRNIAGLASLGGAGATDEQKCADRSDNKRQ